LPCNGRCRYHRARHCARSLCAPLRVMSCSGSCRHRRACCRARVVVAIAGAQSENGGGLESGARRAEGDNMVYRMLPATRWGRLW
jgi:hypothetical protein